MVGYNRKFVVWGFTYSNYTTHTHIHEGFFRALKYLFPESLWLDQSSDISEIDFSNTTFITNWDLVATMPRGNNCTYVVHGLNDHREVRELFKGKNHLSWNVYIDTSIEFAQKYGIPLTERIELEKDVILYPLQRHMEFRWATDLLPHEFEKPEQLLSLKSDVINYVGSIWRVNKEEIKNFREAVVKDGKTFKHIGAGQKGIITVEENIRLVRESYMAPAISGTHHLTEGYVPCRIFKNISYGQMGITNSKRVNDLFDGRLIFHPDCYTLYYEAKEKLQSLPIEKVWELMDFVRDNHTYINRINSIIEAINKLQ